jgi:hypothetical protein
MVFSESKSAGHNVIDISITEDAKLARLGYEQGMERSLWPVVSRRLQGRDADHDRTQKIFRSVGHDRIRLQHCYQVSNFLSQPDWQLEALGY